jgi:hypothetical protein
VWLVQQLGLNNFPDTTFGAGTLIGIGANDNSEDIRRALKSTTMPSLLGGTYAMDDHNHPDTPMQVVDVRGGKMSVIALVGG